MTAHRLVERPGRSEGRAAPQPDLTPRRPGLPACRQPIPPQGSAAAPLRSCHSVPLVLLLLLLLALLVLLNHAFLRLVLALNRRGGRALSRLAVLRVRLRLHGLVRGLLPRAIAILDASCGASSSANVRPRSRPSPASRRLAASAGRRSRYAGPGARAGARGRIERSRAPPSPGPACRGAGGAV